MITAGVDIGSTTSKAVLFDGRSILGAVVMENPGLPPVCARTVFDACLEQARLPRADVGAVATTGYGRRLANFGELVITEIKAAATGAVFLGSPHGAIHTLLDVGGQDTKVISISDAGEVEDFAMNDKCAAGTGRFLEMLAKKLNLAYEEFVALALKSATMIHMNSTCAVFAESEVVSLLARGVDKADIAMAAHQAIADRVGSMLRRVGTREVICFVGGGARNHALAQTIEESLNHKVFIPESPQTIVALGAAVEAHRRETAAASGGAAV